MADRKKTGAQVEGEGILYCVVLMTRKYFNEIVQRQKHECRFDLKNVFKWL